MPEEHIDRLLIMSLGQRRAYPLANRDDDDGDDDDDYDDDDDDDEDDDHLTRNPEGTLIYNVDICLKCLSKCRYLHTPSYNPVRIQPHLYLDLYLYIYIPLSLYLYRYIYIHT